MATKRTCEIRPLRPDDLARVVEIDSALAGRSRRGFFEKRLQAALDFAGDFIALGALDGHRLNGYVIARLQSGEFGEDRRSAMLDAIGVDPDFQRAGLGHELMKELEKVMKQRGAGELLTQISWDQHALAQFFASRGFSLAPIPVLELPLGRGLEL